MIYPTLNQPTKSFQAILLAYISNKAAMNLGKPSETCLEHP